MNPLSFLLRLSTRWHLVLGLAATAVGVVFSATLLGLVPDGEALTRQHRGSLAETVAVTVSGLVDETQPEILEATLEFIRSRNPDLLSIGVRTHDNLLVVDVGEHGVHWSPGPHERSTESELFVPVWNGTEPWGQVELRFPPLRSAGWIGHLQDPGLKLAAFVFIICLPLFYLYLRRMLRELDPSRAVPARVRTAYDTLTEGLLVLDGEGSIVLANKSTSLMLGIDETQLVGHSPSEFSWTTPDGTPLEAGRLPWVLALASHQLQRDVHLRVQNADGAIYALRANCSPIVAGKGVLQALVVSFQDVTELEQRGEALLEAKEQADAANEAKSRFLANMSHEIRTPMNAILGFTEILRRGGLRQPADAASHLEIIHSSGRHLLNLINDILDLSKVEAGRLEAERLPVAPHLVAHEVILTLTERASEKGLQLVQEFPQPLPASIVADPARIRQILTNLIGNAIKFTEHGHVTIRHKIERHGAEAQYCIEVADSGIGIAADKLESVFEPFVQAESSTTRRFGGTGLGLTISRGFARAMGGDIIATSVLGEGTTFTLRLEAGDLSQASFLDPAALSAVQSVAQPVAGVRWRFQAKRVLVVDDGVENRQLVRVLLEDVGLQVSEAENGQIALDRLAAETFDLVLMDMQMPVMDGQTATRTLRERGFTLPIIALTANAMKGFEHELEVAGFSGFQTKPIDIDALLFDLAERLGGEVLAEAQALPAIASGSVHAPLVSRLAGNQRLARIVGQFVSQLPEKLDLMSAASARSDYSELANLAHWLKGAGGSMGFDDLFEPAKLLEEASTRGDAVSVSSLLDDIRILTSRIAQGADPGLGVQEAPVGTQPRLLAAEGSTDAPIISRLAHHEKLGRIVIRFVAQLPEKLAEMHTATERGDMAELSALAHWLKGAGGSMGFDELFDPAKSLEEAAGRSERETISSTLSDLQSIARRIALGASIQQNRESEKN